MLHLHIFLVAGKKEKQKNARPKSAGFFKSGTYGTKYLIIFYSLSLSLSLSLRKSILRGSKPLLYAVEEEDSSAKNKAIVRETRDMEQFFESLMVSGSNRMDEQRMTFSSPTHHILPVDGTDSGHSSLENTTFPPPSHSATNSYSEDIRQQSKLISIDAAEKRIPLLTYEQRARSRSEDNVFQSLEEKGVVYDDLRTSSEALLLHKHEMSYSSDALSDGTQEDSLNVSHDSTGFESALVRENAYQDHRPVDWTHTSVSPAEYQAELKRRSSLSALYSATLGFCGNLEKRKTSLNNGYVGRKISLPVMTEWEEDVVEM